MGIAGVVLAACSTAPAPPRVNGSVPSFDFDASSSPSARHVNWPAYLFDAGHTSVSRASAITPDNAAELVETWQWRPDPASKPGQPYAQLFAGPTAFEGRVYIGSNTGDFYAIDEDTGATVWKQFLGFRPAQDCGGRGITSTAAARGDPDGAVSIYVGGGDGYLYDLDGATGEVRWKSPVATEESGYNWSSPSLAGGRVYIGVSSQCDVPLIRGGVREFDADTGESMGTFWGVPEGQVGSSVWSSVAVTSDDRSVFVATGNAPSSIGDSFSVVRLAGDDLRRMDAWKLTGFGERDYDFGASPTLFSATIGGKKVAMVGTCNKNGVFYAFRQRDLAAGPVWTKRISVAWPEGNCLGGAVWDSRSGRLLIQGAKTSLAGKPYAGSVSGLDPGTGQVIWEVGLAGGAWGSSSMDGAGVLAVPNYGATAPNQDVFLVSAVDGRLLAALDVPGAGVFGQPAFTDRYLLVPSIGQGLFAYTPSG
jgi:polyvinyl alcohol dehydrogenase (cytochrome)